MDGFSLELNKNGGDKTIGSGGVLNRFVGWIDDAENQGNCEPIWGRRLRASLLIDSSKGVVHYEKKEDY